jgi:THAP domain
MDFEKKRKCCIPICEGEKFDLVHKLPMAAEQAAHWRNILAGVLPEINTYSNEEIRKKYFVCYRHFTNADYKNIESRNLNKTAFPSVNLSDLSESHACLRLRFHTNPNIPNLHLTPGESKISSIDLQRLDTSPNETMKRKIDATADKELLIPSKRVKIVYQRKCIQPPKQQQSFADSSPRPLNSKIENKEQRLNTTPRAQYSNNPKRVDTISDTVVEQNEAIVLENFLPNPEEDTQEAPDSPKKLVALFEVKKYQKWRQS